MNIKKKQKKYFRMDIDILKQLEDLKKMYDVSYTEIIETAISDLKDDDIINIVENKKEMRSYYFGKESLLKFRHFKSLRKNLSFQRMINVAINKMHKETT